MGNDFDENSKHNVNRKKYQDNYGKIKWNYGRKNRTVPIEKVPGVFDPVQMDEKKCSHTPLVFMGSDTDEFVKCVDCQKEW